MQAKQIFHRRPLHSTKMSPDPQSEFISSLKLMDTEHSYRTASGSSNSRDLASRNHIRHSKRKAKELYSNHHIAANAKNEENTRSQSLSTGGNQYDFLLSASDALLTVEDDPTVGSLPRQQGQPGLDFQNCSQPVKTSHHQFPSGTVIIESNHNQSVSDLLKVCAELEVVEIDDTDDVYTLIGSIHRHVLKFSDGPPNSAVFFINLENYSKWTKEKVLEVFQTVADTMSRKFNDFMIYKKIDGEKTSAPETEMHQLKNYVKLWLSDLCSAQVGRCAELTSIGLGYETERSSDHEDSLEPVYPTLWNGKQSDVATQQYCRRLGLGPGTRIIELKEVHGEILKFNNV